MSILVIIAIGGPLLLIVGTIIAQKIASRPKKLSKKAKRDLEIKQEKERLRKEGTKSITHLHSLAQSDKGDLKIPLKKHHKGLLDWDSYELEGGELKENQTLEFFLPIVPAGVFWHIDQGAGKDGELSLRFRQEGGPTTLATVVLPDSSDQAKTILGASYLALELADKNHRDLIDVYVKRPKKAFSEFEGEFE